MSRSAGAMYCALMCVAIPALADPLSLDPKFLQNAAAINAGNVEFFPAIFTDGGYDSNIYESHRHSRESFFAHVAPELSALFPFNSGAGQITYQAARTQYEESSADSFTDQLLLGRFHFNPSARHRFEGDYSWNGAHEARGTALTEGFDPDTAAANDTGPDKLIERRSHLKYEFGAISAPGNLRFSFDTLQHDYTNHRERTQYFDRDEMGAGITFLWHVFPRTALLFETRGRDINYETIQPGQPSLDSHEYDYLTGVEWKASEQTQAGLRVGRKNKEFSSAQRKDSTELAWEFNASWRPRTYSIFQLDFHRSPAETNGFGDFIDMRSYSLQWQHDWSQRFTSKTTAAYDQAFYQGANEDRSTRALQLQFNYRMYRWLIWKMAYDLRDRNSDIDTLNMVRNRYTLGVEITL